MKHVAKSERAYTNLDFLHSPEARTIRILAEFLEPLRRFKKFAIRNTVVFFGSARVKTPEAAKKKLLSMAKRNKNSSRQLRKAFEDTEIEARMSRYYGDALELAKMLTRWSGTLDDHRKFVICSGGGPGIMEAANRGASLAGGKSIGLNITLPFEQGSNSYVTQGLGFLFHYFFMRKFWFVYLAKALVFFPGGFGTLDELFEVLTLVQTRKLRKKVAIVIYGKDYWNEVLNLETMVKHKTILPNDLKLFYLANTPQEAFQYRKKELTKNFQRMRNNF